MGGGKSAATWAQEVGCGRQKLGSKICAAPSPSGRRGVVSHWRKPASSWRWWREVGQWPQQEHEAAGSRRWPVASVVRLEG